MKKEKRKHILIIYTGGTIGMVPNPVTKAYEPFNFRQIESKVPELKRFDCKVSTVQFNPPLDSSDISPDDWVKMAEIIEENYAKYNGFVILHGTDTMAYSASALSFMLENLHKPVIFTGAQLPIGIPRTDGRENLLTSIEIASAEQNYEPVVPEVCIYFENRLYRGNRTSKNSAEYFNAFLSPNHPSLAQAGVHIKYNFAAINSLRNAFNISCATDTASFLPISLWRYWFLNSLWYWLLNSFWYSLLNSGFAAMMASHSFCNSLSRSLVEGSLLR
jgi:L-asparaginase